MGIGKSPRIRKRPVKFSLARAHRKYELGGQPPQPRPFHATIDGVRCKVYLVPANRKTRGDVIIVPRIHPYVGFLDHIDEERLSNGQRWYTLYFDCMAALWFTQNAGRLVQPGFRFDEVATAAGSCIIELSVELAQMRALNQQLTAVQGPKPFQHLQPGSWWLLGESSMPGPNTLVATKHMPYPGSTDPTTILSAGHEVATQLTAIQVPVPQLLRALVAVSHPGPLAQRYPGR